MATNVPTPTFGATGFVPPAEAAILAGVQADINAAFGGGLNQSLETPQGQLASSMAAIIGNTNDQFIAQANGVDPNFASGRFQDAIARIYFLQRNPSLPTTINVVCAGLAGVIIPVGALIQDNGGNTYSCTTQGTIASTGSVTLPFANLTPGPIAIPATVAIFRAIPGWDSVTVSGGTVGTNVESRADFEKRRQQSVAGNSAGSVASVRGAVLAVNGVLDAYVTENTTNASATIGGVTLSPHSLYVAVVGGAAADVARAIWSRKMPGCDYNGNTTVQVQDNASGYSPPFPTYNVTYQIPASLSVFFSVNIVNSPQVPSNGAALVQGAILQSFSGQDGGTKSGIGSTILASRFMSNVASLGGWAQINSLQIGSTNTPSALITGSIDGTGVLNVTTVTSGTLAAGQFLLSNGTVVGTGVIVTGVQIVAQLTGTAGGVGTYSTTSTVPAAFQPIMAVAANLNKVTVNINQNPVTVSAAIAVVFT